MNWMILIAIQTFKVQIVHWPFVTYLDNQWWSVGYLLQFRHSKYNWNNGPMLHIRIINDELEEIWCNAGHPKYKWIIGPLLHIWIINDELMDIWCNAGHPKYKWNNGTMEVQQFVLVAVQEPTYFSLTKKLLISNIQNPWILPVKTMLPLTLIQIQKNLKTPTNKKYFFSDYQFLIYLSKFIYPKLTKLRGKASWLLMLKRAFHSAKVGCPT